MPPARLLYLVKIIFFCLGLRNTLKIYRIDEIEFYGMARKYFDRPPIPGPVKIIDLISNAGIWYLSGILFIGLKKIS
jgi:hypothetical protein